MGWYPNYGVMSTLVYSPPTSHWHGILNILYYWNVQFLNNVTVIELRLFSSRDRWPYPMLNILFGFLASQSLILFGFPIFWRWPYLMKFFRNGYCVLHCIFTKPSTVFFFCRLSFPLVCNKFLANIRMYKIQVIIISKKIRCPTLLSLHTLTSRG